MSRRTHHVAIYREWLRRDEWVSDLLDCGYVESPERLREVQLHNRVADAGRRKVARDRARAERVRCAECGSVVRPTRDRLGAGDVVPRMHRPIGGVRWCRGSWLPAEEE